MKSLRSLLPIASVLALTALVVANAQAQHLHVPMDDAQTDHLRAYGLTWWCLDEPREYECQWLLNYRAGSFLLPDHADVRERAAQLGVSLEAVGPAEQAQIDAVIERSNMQRMHLTKAPRVAVYTPAFTEPWDDAVTLALTYAEEEYDTIWDREVIAGALTEYD